MSFEQLSNEEFFDKKHKQKQKESQQEFFESQKLRLETSRLLQSLAQDISRKYGLDIVEVKRLIEDKTYSNLEDLQKSLWNDESINIKNLLWEINNAKTLIEDLSKKHRDQLKNSISRFPLEVDKHDYISSRKIFSKPFIARIQEPKNISDNILWAGVWIIDSSEAVIFFLYNLGKWILLTPYHVYLLLRWEGKIKL